MRDLPEPAPSYEPLPGGKVNMPAAKARREYIERWLVAGYRQKEIARAFGVTPARIAQMRSSRCST